MKYMLAIDDSVWKQEIGTIRKSTLWDSES